MACRDNLQIRCSKPAVAASMLQRGSFHKCQRTEPNASLDAQRSPENTPCSWKQLATSPMQTVHRFIPLWKPRKTSVRALWNNSPTLPARVFTGKGSWGPARDSNEFSFVLMTPSWIQRGGVFLWGLFVSPCTGGLDKEHKPWVLVLPLL